MDDTSYGPARAQSAGWFPIAGTEGGSIVTRVTPVIIAAAALLLALDIVGALAGQPLGFPYTTLGAVSLLTYFTVGVMGAWRAQFGLGVIAAVIVGFLDATLGPLAAWMI